MPLDFLDKLSEEGWAFDKEKKNILVYITI